MAVWLHQANPFHRPDNGKSPNPPPGYGSWRPQDYQDPPCADFFNVNGDQTADGANVQTPPGEQSIWNNSATPQNPFSAAQNANGGTASIQTGQVLLWAEEANRNQSVPHDAIVWIRSGESYIDPGSGFPRVDYTFLWSSPIWMRIDEIGCDAYGNANGDYEWSEVQRVPVDYTNLVQGMQWYLNPNGCTVAP